MIDMRLYEQENLQKDLQDHVKIGVFTLMFVGIFDPIFFSGDVLKQWMISRAFISIIGLFLVYTA